MICLFFLFFCLRVTSFFGTRGGKRRFKCLTDQYLPPDNKTYMEFYNRPQIDKKKERRKRRSVYKDWPFLMAGCGWHVEGGRGGQSFWVFFFVFLCVSVDFGMQLSGFTLEAVGSTLVFEQTQWFLFIFFFFFFVYCVCFRSNSTPGWNLTGESF